MAEKLAGQGVEDDTPVQDQGQTGESSDIQPEQSPTTAPNGEGETPAGANS